MDVPSAALTETLIHRPDSYVDRLSMGSVFGNERPVELELGSGDGTFLAHWAALYPERNFLGIERLLGRLRKLDRKARRLGLNNIRLLRLEARYLLACLVPDQSVEVIHVYFPDPWPKRRQQKNRLINEEFAVAAARILKPGGLLYLRTDDRKYFDRMTSVFAASPRFRAVETPPELQKVVTDFEKDFNDRGITTCRAAYSLQPGPMV